MRMIQTVAVRVLIQAAKVWSNPVLGIRDTVVKRQTKKSLPLQGFHSSEGDNIEKRENI